MDDAAASFGDDKQGLVSQKNADLYNGEILGCLRQSVKFDGILYFKPGFHENIYLFFSIFSCALKWPTKKWKVPAKLMNLEFRIYKLDVKNCKAN